MLVGFYTVATLGFYAWMLKSASPLEEEEGTHAPQLRVVDGGRAVGEGEDRRAA